MDDEKGEIDPFSYQAPIPKPVRFVLVMPTPVLLIVILINAAEGLDLPQSTLQVLFVLLVTSVGIGLALQLADWLAWRLSPDFVPGLRKQKIDEAIQASTILRGFAFGFKGVDLVLRLVFFLNLLGLVILLLLFLPPFWP